MNIHCYNPCSDGVGAKIWECLRRNEKFRALLKTQREVDKKDRADSWAAHSGLSWETRFSYIAEEYLLPVFYRNDHAVTAKPRFHESTTWPKTPKVFRNKIESEFRRISKPPFLLIEPPFDDPNAGWDFLTGVESALQRWLYDARGTWANYDVIAVPKIIRDSDHRKEILADVGKIVRVTPRKAISLKPAGSFLGTKKEWEAFLVAEYWENRGADTLRARGITTCHFYEKSHFENWTEAEILNNKIAVKHAKQVCDQYGSQIKKYISAIDRAIASVYPRFEPFAAGTRGEAIKARWDDSWLNIT